ncbi:low molecular weight protein-tyrosine-phosphatase [Flavobacterium sp.]|uniref:low molecular weight protein-tyrosine-phosphatase n=1 Tax=Flavobacterium sp. TaxID=239 RepID=UPI0008C3D453|nr:low molecular weight protein-tyrosine-phosphatase [Flavobacterium sp.]OGS65086.1 MAG: protein-tyrosine-phosphatase [Flavobacteria bacterium GWA2_35_26]HCF03316.1 protein-tyrosine-phosphatase [Flavobacterium sp.]
MSVKIVMVCLGNICRSPLAEGILDSKLPQNTFHVDSAGTGSWHIGQSPDERSIAVAQKNGLDISQQKGRQFSSADFDTFDYIFVMDSSNYDNVIALAETKEHKEKVKLIMNELTPNQNQDVPDPYFGMHNGFDIVYKMLDDACEVIAQKLIAQHQ